MKLYNIFHPMKRPTAGKIVRNKAMITISNCPRFKRDLAYLQHSEKSQRQLFPTFRAKSHYIFSMQVNKVEVAFDVFQWEYMTFWRLYFPYSGQKSSESCWKNLQRRDFSLSFTLCSSQTKQILLHQKKSFYIFFLALPFNAQIQQPGNDRIARICCWKAIEKKIEWRRHLPAHNG